MMKPTKDLPKGKDLVFCLHQDMENTVSRGPRSAATTVVETDSLLGAR